MHRQKASLKSLQGERKERLKLAGQNKGNIADLIAYWENAQKRKNIVLLAEIKRKELKNEINRLKDMSEIDAEIYGISEEELLD